jgi:hypothetical protein
MKHYALRFKANSIHRWQQITVFMMPICCCCCVRTQMRRGEREREGVGEGEREREREVGQDDDDNDRTVPPLHIHLSSLGNMFLRT